MSPTAASEQLKALAPDLRRAFPRSPRATLAGYIIAARALDKCRAVLNGTQGEYKFNCLLDRLFFDFTGIDAETFQAFVATGANDETVAGWIEQHAQPRQRLEVIRWNNHYRCMTLKEAPDQVQLNMEDYIARHIPPDRMVCFWFDVYDIEEQRL